MAEMLLVNPRRRKRRKTSSRRKTTSRRRRRRSHAVAAAPRRRRRRAVGYTIGSRPIRRRKLNPSRRRSLTRGIRRRRRHNPSLRGIASGAVPTMKAGFTGALGALGLDLLWGYGKSYLPVSIAGSALAQYAAKLVGALLIGFVGQKVMRGKGQALAVGAATVVIHDALKAQVQASFPSIPMGEYLSYAPAVGVMGRASMLDTGVPSSGMGQYLGGLPHTADDMSYSGDYTSDGMNGYG